MDDLDITVDWQKIEQAHALFNEHNPTDIDGTEPKSFKFHYMNHPIDIMAYFSETGIGPASERVMVSFAGTTLWTKTIDFYLGRMRKDHPIRKAAYSFFNWQDV